MNTLYDHGTRDAYWQARWREAGLFEWQRDDGARNFYILEMFPYTSGKMHIGHARNYSMGDTVARMQRARGFNVLYPMGWDSFGLPAENAAKKSGENPAVFTREAIRSMRAAMDQLGLSYSWGNEITTCDATYIHAQQSLFLDIYARGLVYQKSSYVYWDPVEETVLANEQVIDGKGWRSGAPVIKRRIAQWFFDIRAYADELYNGIDKLTEWPASVRNIQRSWIGRSIGAEIDFAVENSGRHLTVFTTRAETIAGCRFIALAPEHDALDWLPMDDRARRAVVEFRDQILVQSSEDRAAAPKAGVSTGLFAINPLTREAVPVLVANYITMDYGTGAVMGVPAHDQRDFEFANRYGLGEKIVIRPSSSDEVDVDAAYEGEGLVVATASEFDGRPSEEVRSEIVEMLAVSGAARHSTQFRLQDWSISRQRYWGCPIPIVHCEHCGPVAMCRDELPLLLPKEIVVEGSGSPLSRDRTWMRTACPTCGRAASRDPDTMDTFVDSSWYFLRFPTPNDTLPVNRTACDSVAPVDIYVGGVEHATLHLIYARFMVKILRDLGYVGFDEPFVRLFNQGMVNDAQGRKQSKSLGNVTEPMKVVDSFGVDALRVYLLFKTSYNAPINWDDGGPRSARQFLERVLRLIQKHSDNVKSHGNSTALVLQGAESEEDRRLLKVTNRTIAKVTRDVEKFSFNTAIAAIMSLTNELYTVSPTESGCKRIFAECIRVLVRLLAPFAPHICEEMWALFGENRLLADSPWPEVDHASLADEMMTIAVQLNGKLVAPVEIPADIEEKDLFTQVLARDDVRSRIGALSVKGYRYVEGRVFNLIVV
ncbi:UNVERIFIED_ORG: leucyl-tRNA synthetase [Burkholderia contaminans]|nr:leucyl-tRNA synthetase [Burkholderia contaminans]